MDLPLAEARDEELAAAGHRRRRPWEHAIGARRAVDRGKLGAPGVFMEDGHAEPFGGTEVASLASGGKMQRLGRHLILLGAHLVPGSAIGAAHVIPQAACPSRSV